MVEFVDRHVADDGGGGSNCSLSLSLSLNLIRVISSRLKAIVSGFYERKLQEANLDSAGG